MPDSDGRRRESSSLRSQNPLVEAAATAERPTRWWVAIIMTFVFYWVVGGLVYLVGRSFGADEEQGYTPFLWAAATFGVTVVVVALWVHFKERRPISTLGFSAPGASRFLLGAALGVVSCLMLVGCAALLGQLGPVDAAPGTSLGASALLPVVLMFLVYLVQGPAEEIVYRGYLMPVLGNHMPIVIAVLASSALWMLNHAGDQGFDLVVMLNLMIFGVFLCLLCLREGSLWLACGLHAAWNWTEAHIVGLHMAGMEPPATLMSMGPTTDLDTRILNSHYGLEGGLLATVYLTLLLVAGWFYFRSGRPQGVAYAAPTRN